MKNRFTNQSDESLLRAVAHINVDPCDPSQDAMHEALSELTRRYTRALAVLAGVSKHADFSQCPPEVEGSVDEAIASAANDGSLNGIMFDRCRDLEG